MKPTAHSEQAELRERGRLELLVGEYFKLARVVHRDQPRLVKVGDFVQFFGDADLIAAIGGRQGAGGNAHVLVVIHGEILPVARARAKRRNAQNVRDELELASVPREYHWAGASQARRLLDLDRAGY